MGVFHQNYKQKLCYPPPKQEISLRMSTREIIPLINVLKQLNSCFNLGMKPPDILCTIYEDNTSYITMDESLKCTLRTKYTSLKYHWFRSLTKGK